MYVSQPHGLFFGFGEIAIDGLGIVAAVPRQIDQVKQNLQTIIAFVHALPPYCGSIDCLPVPTSDERAACRVGFTSDLYRKRIVTTPLQITPPNSKRLLIYGRENMLLDTRRRILETAGFAVDANIVLPDIQAQLAADPGYALLIVCHTAPAGDRRALAELAEEAAVPIFQIEILITPADLLKAAAGATR